MKTKYTRVPDRYELHWLYIDGGKTLTEIGDLFSTSSATARNWLIAAGIKLRSQSEAQLRGVSSPTKSELEMLYIDKNMTTTDIGEMLGVNHSTISRWLKKYGIDKKTLTNAHLRHMVRPSDDELCMLYVTELHTVVYLADMWGVSDSSVRAWLLEAGIHVRSYSESQLRGKTKPSSEELYKMYTHDKLTAREMAGVFGVSDAAILAWLEDAGIPRRTVAEALKGKFVGEKNPKWTGGSDKYCHLFNFEFKEIIRDKYDRRCFLCGKPEEDNGVRLSVHHTNFGRRCLCDFDCRFVPLCMSCHGKTNGDRYKWFSVIMRKLYLEASAEFVCVHIYF